MGRWPAHWRARWIWNRRPPVVWLAAAPEPDPHHRDEMAGFRRELVLDRAPGRLPVRVTADGRYALWINGREASRGPVRSPPGTLFFDEFDAGPLMRAGSNLVEVVVRHYAHEGPWWRPAPAFGELGRGGFLLEALDNPVLDTGEEWLTSKPGWSSGPPLAFAPPNERVTATDRAEWSPAVVLAGAVPGPPFTLVRPSPLPAPTDGVVEASAVMRAATVGDLPAPSSKSLPVDPLYARGGRLGPRIAARLPADLPDGEALVVDFGQMVLGLVEVDVDATPGCVVTLRCAEGLSGDDPADVDRQWTHVRVCRGDGETVAPFEAMGLRYLFVSASAAARVTGARVRERIHGMTETGSFASDDPVLERLWRVGVRTLRLCSTDAFVDCPGREQRTWVGDSYLHTLVTFCATDDPSMVVHSLRLAAWEQRTDGLLPMVAAGDLAAHPLTIPDFSLHWIRALARLYEHTGDAGIVAELLPKADPVLDWFMAFAGDGVLGPVPGWVFIDWCPLPEGPIASLQGLLVCALEDHAALARVVGDVASAGRSRARADDLRAGMRAFRDAGRGVFTEDVEHVQSTQHAVAMSVLAGVVQGAEAAEMLGKVADTSRVRDPVFDPDSLRAWGYPPGFDPRVHVLGTQTFFAHWLHQAFARAGRHDLLLGSLRRWKGFLDSGDGSFWEFWPGEGARFSHAHGWSSTPVCDLTRHVLGVRPLSPGWTTVEVRPWFGPLMRLAGRVPTPLGPVEVDLARDQEVSGRIVLPSGSSGTLHLPDRSLDLSPGLNSL
ncbi:MAG TPA: family 78 glycoside hydrolase catalytic domain [Actinomycetota bacterium]|nr:family 78 glycoside hydrolase catalytic domain [Actinomycetota bacterium]